MLYVDQSSRKLRDSFAKNENKKRCRNLSRDHFRPFIHPDVICKHQKPPDRIALRERNGEMSRIWRA